MTGFSDITGGVQSRQVFWFAVYEFSAHLLASVDNWPRAGTPAWQQLPDDDPRKLAAVVDAGVHWTLRVDVEQTIRAAAAQSISTATDWTVVAQRTRTGRGRNYIPRKAAS